MNAAIPPLEVEGHSVEPNGFPILVLWKAGMVSRYLTLSAAEAAVSMRGRFPQDASPISPRVYFWDGKAWIKMPKI